MDWEKLSQVVPEQSPRLGTLPRSGSTKFVFGEVLPNTQAARSTKKVVRFYVVLNCFFVFFNFLLPAKIVLFTKLKLALRVLTSSVKRIGGVMVPANSGSRRSGAMVIWGRTPPPPAGGRGTKVPP